MTTIKFNVTTNTTEEREVEFPVFSKKVKVAEKLSLKEYLTGLPAEEIEHREVIETTYRKWEESGNLMELQIVELDGKVVSSVAIPDNLKWSKRVAEGGRNDLDLVNQMTGVGEYKSTQAEFRQAADAFCEWLNSLT